MTRILVVDNYDSFVYTIVGYLQQLGAETVVVRNDAVPPLDERGSFDGVLVSPGPGTPADAGQSLQVIRDCASTGTPMLGVCLGHQALGEAFGATVTHAPEPCTARRASSSTVTGECWRACRTPSPRRATTPSPSSPALCLTSLEVTAEVDGAHGTIIMGLAHRELPLHGVQFHPESVLTEGGHRLLANWLEICGSTDAVERAEGLAPLLHR